GMVRLFSATNGSVLKEFVSVPLTKGAIAQARPVSGGAVVSPGNERTVAPEALPDGARIASLEVQPGRLKFASPNDYAQLLVTARLESGDMVDVTRLVKFAVKPELA